MYTYNHPILSILSLYMPSYKGKSRLYNSHTKVARGKKKKHPKTKKKIKNQKNLRSCLLTQLEKNCKRKSRKIRFLE